MEEKKKITVNLCGDGPVSVSTEAFKKGAIVLILGSLGEKTPKNKQE